MRSRAALAAVSTALALLCSGCFRATFKLSKAVPEAGAPREMWHHSVLSGLVDVSGPVQLDKLCPQGIASVQTEESVANGFAQNLSSVVFSTPGYLVNPFLVVGGYWLVGRHLQPWAPSTVRLTCARGAVKSLKLVVLKLEPRGGLEAQTVDLFTDALVGELRRNPAASVMTSADVAAVLGNERQRQLLGCTADAVCLAELGGALGADRIIHGSVGRVGDSLVVNLTSLDPKSGRAVASVSERLKGGGDEAFLDALPSLSFQILSEPLNAP